jgi:hypothetical protein
MARFAISLKLLSTQISLRVATSQISDLPPVFDGIKAICFDVQNCCPSALSDLFLKDQGRSCDHDKPRRL